MPKVDGVGFGQSTPIKIQHLSKILDMHIAITQAVLKKYAVYRKKYRYVDLTAGKGHTPDGLKGSPLVFLETIESKYSGLSYRADFVECEAVNFTELQTAIQREALSQGWRGKDVHFYQGQYQQHITDLFGQSAASEFGLVFVDHSGDPPDFDALHEIAVLRPKMEILIYLSATNIKRLYQHTHKLLSDYMDAVGKKHWLIRKPFSWDRHEWTFLLGSNSSLFKNYKTIDFWQIESELAQQYFAKLNLTGKQRQEKLQPPLL